MLPEEDSPLIKLPTIGILAGMGPRSTAPFINQLIDESILQYGAQDDIDFPKMHIISLPTPFYPDKKIDDAAMIHTLQTGIAELAGAKVDSIAIPCNIAHNYFSEIKKACHGITLFHIADCAISCIPADLTRVIVIGTASTIDAGFYQQRLALANKTVVASHSIQDEITLLIKQVKRSGFYCQQVLKQWHDIMQKISLLNAQACIIACTDLSPLLIYPPNSSITIVDASLSLAKATIADYISRFLQDE